MNKTEGFAFRQKCAIRKNVCLRVPVPYDDKVYRQRCISWNNAFDSAINDREFRKQWLDREMVTREGYSLDSSLES